MSEGGSSHRKVYGRGLMDGLRMAGIDDPRGFMNTAKIETASKGLTGIAAKVYEVVPYQEVWKTHQVVQEMGRLGSKPDFAIVNGVLDNLKQKRLVIEPQRGYWQKVKPKEEKPLPQIKLVQDKSPVPANTGEIQDMTSPLDAIANIGKSLRDLSKQADKIASEIDSIAISIEERIMKQGEEASKLRQLQQLLKSIGD